VCKKIRKPVIEEISPMGLGPTDILEEMRNHPFPFLLDSAKTKSDIGQYSFLGCDPFMTFKSKGDEVTISSDGEESRIKGNPVHILRGLMKKFPLEQKKNFPLFQGGVVGVLSYDLHHIFEILPKTTSDDLETPDTFLLFVDALIVFDHFAGKVFIVSTGYPQTEDEKVKSRVVERIKFLEGIVKNAKIGGSVPPSLNAQNLSSNFSKESFEKMVCKAKDYIMAGDIFQVNISQRLSVDFSGDPFLLYRVLRQINPSPFGNFIDFHDFQVVSSSPERLIKKDGSAVETRPIAGTRPRGKNSREDLTFSSELSLNEKERAEHIMLVDLERNDIGRVSTFGSVHVNDLMVIEDYSHVFHIVSNVKGELIAEMDAFDVLEACFPGGTITGTPKIRSMEIIDELEPTRRGVYTGSVGYISFGGDMDLNIIIRTFFVKGGKAFIQAGCGVVADSVPQKEYFETLYKAQALLLALGYDNISSLNIKVL